MFASHCELSLPFSEIIATFFRFKTSYVYIAGAWIDNFSYARCRKAS